MEVFRKDGFFNWTFLSFLNYQQMNGLALGGFTFTLVNQLK